MKNVAVIPIALGSKRIPDKDVEEPFVPVVEGEPPAPPGPIVMV